MRFTTAAYDKRQFHAEVNVGSQVTRKGQITIPEEVRDFLDIKLGSVVECEPIADGRVAITATDRKVSQGTSSRFARLRGTATVKMSLC